MFLVFKTNEAPLKKSKGQKKGARVCKGTEGCRNLKLCGFCRLVPLSRAPEFEGPSRFLSVS